MIAGPPDKPVLLQVLLNAGSARAPWNNREPRPQEAQNG